MIAKDSQQVSQGRLGRHVVADFIGCDPSLLEHESYLLSEAKTACILAGATVLSVHGHKFEPQGATAVVLLAESHLSIHTWPEHEYVAVDVFTCGSSLRPEDAVNHLARSLGAQRYTIRMLDRGVHARGQEGAIAFMPQLIESAAAAKNGKNGHTSPSGSPGSPTHVGRPLSRGSSPS